MSKFEIVQSDDGFHARIVANGRIIMSSEVYTRRRGALNAIRLAMESEGFFEVDERAADEPDDEPQEPPC